jgi:CubicO group peptidase (beta-lactamase class C family)
MTSEICNKLPATIFVNFILILFCSSTSAQSYVKNIGAISPILDSFEKHLDFNGVVLITKSDSVLFHKGYGYDANRKNASDKNTVYHIASVSKAFTALAILKLAEQKKLGLQDLMAKYFTNAPVDKSGISIHQLLIHQSGLPQTYAAEGESDADKAANKIWKLKSEPSGKFIYSNGNYTLLAIIIEKVTGKKWEEYIKEAILTPLEMNHTYFWADENKTSFPEAKPNSKIKKRKRDYGYLGSTGIFSTATDLLKFQNALKTNVIVNTASKALWAGRYVKLKSAMANSTDYYAYGIFFTDGPNNSIWLRGNEEAWGGSIVYWFPKSNTSVIVLSGKEKLSNGEKQHIYVSSRIIQALND